MEETIPFETGIWMGHFYGEVNGSIGGSVRKDEDDIAEHIYFVTPAILTAPSRVSQKRSIVWIGAVSSHAGRSTIGSLSRDHDARLLSLTLRMSRSQMSTFISLLRNKAVTDFLFDVSRCDDTGDGLVSDWTADIRFRL